MMDLEHDEMCEQKKQRIADLLEQFILDTVMSTMKELIKRRNGIHSVSCYKFGCTERENIPF